MLRALNDAEHAGEARAALAETQRRKGALDQAAASYERAIEYFKEAGNASREASATLALGHVERTRGRIEDAWQRYYLALRLYEKAENARGQASASLALGHIDGCAATPRRPPSITPPPAPRPHRRATRWARPTLRAAWRICSPAARAMTRLPQRIPLLMISTPKRMTASARLIRARGRHGLRWIALDLMRRPDSLAR